MLLVRLVQEESSFASVRSDPAIRGDMWIALSTSSVVLVPRAMHNHEEARKISVTFKR